jgi:hypothetical protein
MPGGVRANGWQRARIRMPAGVRANGWQRARIRMPAGVRPKGRQRAISTRRLQEDPACGRHPWRRQRNRRQLGGRFGLQPSAWRDRCSPPLPRCARGARLHRLRRLAGSSRRARLLRLGWRRRRWPRARLQRFRSRRWRRRGLPCRPGGRPGCRSLRRAAGSARSRAAARRHLALARRPARDQPAGACRTTGSLSQPAGGAGGRARGAGPRRAEGRSLRPARLLAAPHAPGTPPAARDRPSGAPASGRPSCGARRARAGAARIAAPPHCG